jgi:hypothetical protein
MELFYIQNSSTTPHIVSPILHAAPASAKLVEMQVPRTDQLAIAILE